MNKLVAFAKTTISSHIMPDNSTDASTPSSSMLPALPGGEKRVDELMSTMTGLFRRATNLLRFSGPGNELQPRAQDGEIVYCKNNVCVHAPSADGVQSTGEEIHHPGYLSLRCQDDEVLGKTLVLTWIPNSTLKKNPASLQTTPDKSPVDPSITSPSGSSVSYNADQAVESTNPSSDSVSASDMGYTIIETPGAAVEKKGAMSLDLTSFQTNSELKTPYTEAECDDVMVLDSSSSSPSTSGPDSPDEESIEAAEAIALPPDVHPTGDNEKDADSLKSPTRDGTICGVFSVDLGLMRYVRLFYTDSGPGRSGQVVIASTESQYKVLHFHNGGLDRLEEVLEEWRFLTRQKSQKHEAAERFYKQYTVVRPRYSIANRHPEEGLHNLVTADVWRSFMSTDGRIEEVFLLRKAIFFGGLDPLLRGEAWPFLLKYYDFESTTEERENLRNDKFLEYQEFRSQRANMTPEEVERFYANVQCTVEKDVVRTDRRHPYYAGEDNDNLEVLKEILLNYAVCHPETGYMQGMSDLLAPILAEVNNQADAYWCFEGLMQRTIFVSSPKDTDMDRQLGYLRELMRLTAPEFSMHLESLGDDATDLLFCHRWILLCFKREFGEREALRLWEACWAHYQTDYFHLFVCVAIVQVYGGDVMRDRLSSDEMLLYFASLAMHMDVNVVLMQARWILHEFRSRATIPCTLSELCLLCGPGMWDSRHVPAVQCVGHSEDTLCPHQASNPSPAVSPKAS